MTPSPTVPSPRAPRVRPTATLAATLLPLALLLASTGCRTPQPSAVATAPDWIVLVKSARVPPWSPWITQFAHHTWLDVKRGSEEQWWRAEVQGRDVGVVFAPIAAASARKELWIDRRAVRLLATIDGEPAHRIAQRLESLCAELDARYAADYLKWPGPNSNTFVADLARELPDLAFVFDGNAVGKDWPGWIDAGLTPSKSGLHLDTPLLGAAVALREGVELHLLGFTAAVRLFPPSLALPFLPELPFGLWNERWCRVPPIPADAPLVVRRPADDAADVERTIERTLELPADGTPLEVVVVDETSGSWAELRLSITPPQPPRRHGTLRCEATLHFEEYDNDDGFEGGVDPGLEVHHQLSLASTRILLRGVEGTAGAPPSVQLQLIAQPTR